LTHSLGTDPNGLPAIAYCDETEKRLLYAVASDRPDTYSLGITVSGDGAVLTDPNAEPNWDDQYAYGTVVSPTAVPAAHWHFVRWRAAARRGRGFIDHQAGRPFIRAFPGDRRGKLARFQFGGSAGTPCLARHSLRLVRSAPRGIRTADAPATRHRPRDGVVPPPLRPSSGVRAEVCGRHLDAPIEPQVSPGPA